jgi:hypothetical protein
MLHWWTKEQILSRFRRCYGRLWQMKSLDLTSENNWTCGDPIHSPLNTFSIRFKFFRVPDNSLDGLLVCGELGLVEFSSTSITALSLPARSLSSSYRYLLHHTMTASFSLKCLMLISYKQLVMRNDRELPMCTVTLPLPSLISSTQSSGTVSAVWPSLMTDLSLG